MECVFCEIVRGKKPREIISETKNTITLLSNPSLMKGHCLVIPKRHIEKISELNEKEKKEIFNELIKVQEILFKQFPGCDIKQNYRPFQKQDNLKVNHLHFHLQPRELFDELYKKSQIYEKNIFRYLNNEELKKIKEEIFNG